VRAHGYADWQQAQAQTAVRGSANAFLFFPFYPICNMDASPTMLMSLRVARLHCCTRVLRHQQHASAPLFPSPRHAPGRHVRRRYRSCIGESVDPGRSAHACARSWRETKGLVEVATALSRASIVMTTDGRMDICCARYRACNGCTQQWEAMERTGRVAEGAVLESCACTRDNTILKK
jgi:hypothetical protein